MISWGSRVIVEFIVGDAQTPYFLHCQAISTIREAVFHLAMRHVPSTEQTPFMALLKDDTGREVPSDQKNNPKRSLVYIYIDFVAGHLLIKPKQVWNDWKPGPKQRVFHREEFKQGPNCQAFKRVNLGFFDYAGLWDQSFLFRAIC